MMKIYLAHGNKGGVGKSFMSTALVDVILASNPNAVVMLVEGDNTQQDVADRFPATPGVVPFRVQLNNPKKGLDTLSNIMTELVESIEGEDDTSNVNVVINTPAGFSETFDEDAQKLMKDICAAFEAEFRIIYCIGDTYVAQQEALQFVKDNNTGASVIFALQEHLLDRQKLERDYADMLKVGGAFIVNALTEFSTGLYLANQDKSLGALARSLEASASKNMSNRIRAMTLKSEIEKIYTKIHQYVLIPSIVDAAGAELQAEPAKKAK